ncbi:MAG: argininosuccinate lyase [Finegoldia sp.]|nr:argininosuccinate lyase [Finegoldia sp.]
MKLWQGMLSGELDKQAEEFNSSIKIDKRMVMEDIDGSIAHSKMLAKQKILSDEDVDSIITGLEGIKKDLKEGKLEVDLAQEDIHTFVEGELTSRIGEAGKKMHTARSRNDQVTTDLKLCLRSEIYEIQDILKDFIKALVKKAEENTETVMPGYTHLQAAQPVSFAHHLMAYAMMGLRDIDRLEDCNKRMKESPLGACALAGTSYDTDRNYEADLMGFDSIMQNSMDAVSDRDYVMEMQAVLGIIAVHLSRLSEELIIWSSQPYHFVTIDDMFSTGSSIMPQKKNPDMAELIRGKTARLIGNINQAYIMVKGLPLAYSKDLQEDKQSIFESIDIVKICLMVMTGMMDTLKVNDKRMLSAAKYGYLNATDIADYLVKKGLAFRDAHHIAARLVAKATEDEKTLDDLDLDTYKEESDLFENDIYGAIDLKTSLNSRKSLGGPSPCEVKRQIKYVKEKLGEENEK